MISKSERNKYLYDNKIVDRVKELFSTSLDDIPEEYIVLLADYIDSLSKSLDEIDVNLSEVIKLLPFVVLSVSEKKFTSYEDKDKASIYDQGNIFINDKLYDKMKKMSFFREVTTALQTRSIGNKKCGLYNGKYGMMFREGEIQFIAEKLYSISSGEPLVYNKNYDEVIGLNNHVVYSCLTANKINEDLLLLFASALGLKKNQIMGIGFNESCYDVLKSYYENIDGFNGKFDSLMEKLDKIYYTDKAIRDGYTDDFSKSIFTLTIRMDNGEEFESNYKTYDDLLCDVQSELIDLYFLNKDADTIREESSTVVNYLTTDELKEIFRNLASLASEEFEEEKQFVKKSV